MKKRFSIICNNERRKFFFESVLDGDHAGWYFAIKMNIDVVINHYSHVQTLEDGERFKSIDEDDYISPGTPITPDIPRVGFQLDSYSSLPN